MDARRIDLSSGITIYVLVKDGVIHLPNPELGKILPAVNRAAMEHFRKHYGISVTQVRGTQCRVKPKQGGSGETKTGGLGRWCFN